MAGIERSYCDTGERMQCEHCGATCSVMYTGEDYWVSCAVCHTIYRRPSGTDKWIKNPEVPTVICGACRSLLNVSWDVCSGVLQVSPCVECLAEQHEEGYAEGYDNG